MKAWQFYQASDMCALMYIYTCMIYIYIYVYTYTYIHMYIYIVNLFVGKWRARVYVRRLRNFAYQLRVIVCEPGLEQCALESAWQAGEIIIRGPEFEIISNQKYLPKIKKFCSFLSSLFFIFHFQSFSKYFFQGLVTFFWRGKKL